MEMTKGLVVIGAAVGVLAACGGSNQPNIARVSTSSRPVVGVSTSPWPGGRAPVVAANGRSAQGVFVPLEQIGKAIPRELPVNPPQDCREGAAVTIVLQGGTARTYGPCNRPASIDLLRFALVRAAEQRHPIPPQNRRVTGREWKKLINDWYDGHVDGWYRCAVVRAAIDHLPTSPPTFSTVRLDFESYARAVCRP
jgi:hypothetical protein